MLQRITWQQFGIGRQNHMGKLARKGRQGKLYIMGKEQKEVCTFMKKTSGCKFVQWCSQVIAWYWPGTCCTLAHEIV